jgi:hypothetical protein
VWTDGPVATLEIPYSGNPAVRKQLKFRVQAFVHDLFPRRHAIVSINDQTAAEHIFEAGEIADWTVPLSPQALASAKEDVVLDLVGGRMRLVPRAQLASRDAQTIGRFALRDARLCTCDPRGLRARSLVATVTIDGTTIANNTAFERGGGVHSQNGALTITNSTLRNNDANQGGGIYVYSGGSLAISSSAVLSNTAVQDAGGIMNGGTLNATNVTIAGNSAGNVGGGLADDIGAVQTNLSFVTLAGNANAPGSAAQ